MVTATAAPAYNLSTFIIYTTDTVTSPADNAHPSSDESSHQILTYKTSAHTTLPTPTEQSQLVGLFQGIHHLTNEWNDHLPDSRKSQSRRASHFNIQLTDVTYCIKQWQQQYYIVVGLSRHTHATQASNNSTPTKQHPNSTAPPTNKSSDATHIGYHALDTIDNLLTVLHTEDATDHTRFRPICNAFATALLKSADLFVGADGQHTALHSTALPAMAAMQMPSFAIEMNSKLPDVKEFALLRTDQSAAANSKHMRAATVFETTTDPACLQCLLILNTTEWTQYLRSLADSGDTSSDSASHDAHPSTDRTSAAGDGWQVSATSPVKLHSLSDSTQPLHLRLFVHPHLSLWLLSETDASSTISPTDSTVLETWLSKIAALLNSPKHKVPP